MDKTITQVLLIEDNPAEALLLRVALEQDMVTSFQVTIVERLKAAVDLLQENDFDVILLDLGLPDSQGLDTFIRLHQESPETSIVILSGLIDEELALQAIRFGAQDYLVKRQETWETAARTIRYAHERQRSQVALRESENRFRDLFEHSPVAYQSLDANGTYTDLNTQLCELLGYEPHELIGESFGELWSPETRSTFPRKIERFKKDGKMEADLQLVKKDGTVIEILMRGKIQHDINGQVIKAHCILHDITTRKITEQAIRESQERFSAVFRSNPLSISITELADGTIIDANESFLNMFGYTRAEILRHTTLELNMGPDPKEWERNIKKLRRYGEVPNTELEFRRKTGEMISVLVSYRLIELNGKQYVLNMLNDITDRKLTEKALKDSERRFTALLENGLDNISLLSVDGVLLWESPATLRALDYEPDQFVGRNIFELLHPDDQERIRDQYRELLQKSGSRQRDTFRLRHSDGSWRWVEAIVTNMLEEPSVSAIVINYHDVTERKQAEEKLRESEAGFVSIFQTNPARICITSFEDGRFLDVNETFLKSGGYTREEVISHTSLELNDWVDPQERIRLRSLLNEQGRIQNFETQFRQKSGGIITVLIFAELIELFGQRCILSVGLDITERKRAEDLLRDREQRLQAIIENEPECIKILAPDGSLLQMNPSGLAMFEADDAETVLGKSVYPIVIPEHRRAFQDLTERVCRGESGKLEFEIVGLKGTHRWLETHAVPMRNEQGEAIGLLGITRDVTERKQAEEALRKSEAVLEQAGQIAQLGAWEIEISNHEDLNANPLVWSDQAYRIFGYEPGEVESSNELFFERVHPDDRQQIMDTISKAIAEKHSYQIEHRIIRPDRTERIVLEHAQITFDNQGQPLRMVGAVQDITERKQAEKALQESEQRYRVLIDQIPAVVYIDDSSTNPGRTQFLSPYIQTMLGFTPDEWIKGGDELWKDRLHPDDRDRVLGEYKRSIQSDEPLDLDYRIYARDERVVWVHDQATTLRDSTGNPHLIHGVLYDITESKQAEASLRESEQRFRSLFNTSPDAIVLIDPHDPMVSWRLLDCNEAACKMNGYTRAELIDQSVDMLNIALGTEEERYAYLDRLRREGVVHVESTHRHKDGHVFPIEISTSLFTIEGRELVLGIDRDITERKRIEAERQTLLEVMRGAISTDDLLQYLNLIHHSVANVIRAENFFVIFHNEATGLFEEIYSVDQYDEPQPPAKLEKSISAYVFRSGKPLLLTQALFEVLVARGEVELVGTNSRSWLGVPLTTSKETIGVMVVQDYQNADQYSESDKDFLASIAGQVAQIIERKQAEEALQESEQRFSSAFEYAPIGIALVALDGHWLKINRALCELTGYTESELLQRTFQDITHPDDLEVDLNYVNRMLAGEIQSYQIEKRYIHKVGQIVWVLLSVSLVLGKDNVPLYFIAQIQDVTQRKQTEVEISRQLSELEALYENGLAISRMLEPKQIAHRIVQVLDQKLAWHHAAVRIYHSESDQLELLALSQPGLNKEQISEQIERINQVISTPDQGLSGWVIRNKTPILISGNLQDDPRYVDTYPGLRCGLYVPIQTSTEIIGSIAVESEQENAFTERDERLLVTLANQAAISFVNARLYLRLQYELSQRSHTEEEIRKLNTELEQRVQERTLEIETTHQRLELATASSGIGVWELKSESDMFYWDERMYEIYGTSPEKFNPTFASWLDFIHPEDRQAEAEKRTLAIAQAGSYESEYRIIRADGSLRYLNSHAVVLIDEKRNFKDMIGVNMDITTIKQAEETLRMANSELERALRMKDEFLANMSHELRTPLNSILGLSESLEEQIAGQLNEKQQKYVHTISESGHHLLTLINDILDLAKIEAGQITLDINKMDVHAICQSSLRIVRQLAQQKNQKIEFAVDEKLDLIWADERRLKQMMVNLLSNAVKFTPEGGRIGLEVHADESDNKVLITVWDSGIGIKDADLPRLFQPFVQLDSGLARESAGTGLGLALVAQMARLHGGSVGVTSQPGMGSRFTIILPWEPALATDTMSRMKITGKFHAVKPGDETNRRTILLVEDTEEVVMMIRDYLESAAYKVVTARNGMEGIALARQVRPDLILMDVQMPGIDGLEATQILRREPEFKHIPIIALTALAMPNDRERCLKAGMDEYLTKPINLKMLVKVIQSFLSGEKDIKPQ